MLPPAMLLSTAAHHRASTPIWSTSGMCIFLVHVSEKVPVQKKEGRNYAGSEMLEQ